MHSFCLRKENCLPTPVLLHILTMGHSLGLYKWRESIKTLFQHCFSANLCPFRETPITPTPPSLLLKLNCDVPFWYGRDHIFPRWWGRKMNGDEIPPGDIHKPRGQLRGRGVSQMTILFIQALFSKSDHEGGSKIPKILTTWFMDEPKVGWGDVVTPSPSYVCWIV